MKIAVVGATGLVGQVILNVLEERNFPVTELIPVASSKSIGKTVMFQDKPWAILTAEEAISKKPDLALFSAGGATSLELAPRFAEQGIPVIDNSSAWRMHPEIPLVVPEINGKELTAAHKIIANPNCSTIQMVMALAPLHARWNMKRLVISTYQSVTGTGVKALEQLLGERAGEITEKAYPHSIDMNCIPQCDVFLENAYTREEMKMVNETRKILGDNAIRITSTCVRVPVKGGHSESVNVEFTHPFSTEEIREVLSQTNGIQVWDNPANFEYPMPSLSEGNDLVWVGRIRRDDSIENGLNLWIVSDNLRKGAATNAVQIAEYLVRENML